MFDAAHRDRIRLVTRLQLRGMSHSVLPAYLPLRLRSQDRSGYQSTAFSFFISSARRFASSHS
jgi:hypothetical protein